MYSTYLATQLEDKHVWEYEYVAQEISVIDAPILRAKQTKKKALPIVRRTDAAWLLRGLQHHMYLEVRSTA